MLSEQMIYYLDFNPHSREGSDSRKEVITMCALEISIHTPVKGVTTINFSLSSVANRFQSTLP